MTYFWQETKRFPHWRVQADDLDVANKLRSRSKFKLVGRGYDRDGSIWLFRGDFSRKDNAVRYLSKIDSKGTEYVND